MSVCRRARVKYILVGGFLGAGKTTAITELARQLVARGTRVGIISNDQSTGLADTAMLRSHGFHVEEIAGGCFCCRFDALLDASERLAGERDPDVILAEPVGSCTDLVATVSYPLRRIHGAQFAMAPLSVLVDPKRAARILGLAPGRAFSEEVVYVYRKQLEEADLIVINKCDTLDDTLRDGLRHGLREAFPRAEVLCCAARDGAGVDAWLEHLLAADSVEAPTMDLDYDRYAEGEALLGWLNATVRLSAEEAFDGNRLLVRMADRYRHALAASGCEIAHLKMTLIDAGPTVAGGSMAAVSLVDTAASPDLRASLGGPILAGDLIINLRAEGDPEVLHRVTDGVLDAMFPVGEGPTAKLEHLDCFRPAKPDPTHRVEVPG